MTPNIINQILPDATLNDIKSKLLGAKDLMPFLLAMTTKQRLTTVKMSRKRFQFVSYTIDSCKVEPLIVPTWVNPHGIENDFTLSNQLLGVESILEDMLIEVRDTRMQLGAEALKASSDVYDHVRKAKDRIPGIAAIYETLKASYPGRGKANKKQV